MVGTARGRRLGASACGNAAAARGMRAWGRGWTARAGGVKGRRMAKAVMTARILGYSDCEVEFEVQDEDEEEEGAMLSLGSW